MKIQRIQPDRSRLQFWPIRLAWGRSSSWFATHGWQVGSELCGRHETSLGNAPGRRDVFGWTLHLGLLKVLFGVDDVEWLDRKRDRACQVQAPPKRAAN